MSAVQGNFQFWKITASCNTTMHHEVKLTLYKRGGNEDLIHKPDHLLLTPHLEAVCIQQPIQQQWYMYASNVRITSVLLNPRLDFSGLQKDK